VEYGKTQIEWCKRLIESGKSVGQVALIMSLQQWQAAELMSQCGHAVKLVPSPEDIKNECLRIRRREVVIPGSDRAHREAGFWLVEERSNGT